MKVLDATFLVDYLAGHPATESFYRDHGGPEESWVIPAPALAEVLVGEGNHPDGDVDDAIEALRWASVYDVDEAIVARAGRIAGAVGANGPFLDGVDATVAAVAEALDGTVVSAEEDLTHPATRKIVAVTEYRD